MLSYYAPNLLILLIFVFLPKRLVTFFLIQALFSVFLYQLFMVLIVQLLYYVQHTNMRMGFSLLFVDFYFTPYITTKHNNNNGMRHETVWLDRTIHCDSIKTRRVVREAAAAVN